MYGEYKRYFLTSVDDIHYIEGWEPIEKGGESRERKRRGRWKRKGERCAPSFSSYSPVFEKLFQTVI